MDVPYIVLYYFVIAVWIILENPKRTYFVIAIWVVLFLLDFAQGW